MEVRDLLSVAAQQRAWSLRESVPAGRIAPFPLYMDFNQRLYLGTAYRRRRPPLSEFTTLAEFVYALETAMFLVMDGHKDKAIPHLESSARVVKEHDWDGRESMRACALECLAQSQIAAHCFEDARESAEAALQDFKLLAAEELGFPRAYEGVYSLASSTTKCLLGHILTRQGEVAAALEVLREGVTELRLKADSNWSDRLPNLVWGLELLAEAYYEAGQLEEALTVLHEIQTYRHQTLDILAGPITDAIFRTQARISSVVTLIIEQQETEREQES